MKAFALFQNGAASASGGTVSRPVVLGSAIVAVLVSVGYLAIRSKEPPVRLKAKLPAKAAPLAVEHVAKDFSLPATVNGKPTSPARLIKGIPDLLRSEVNFATKILALSRLGSSLRPDEQAELLAYLKDYPNQRVLPTSQQRALANDIINVLRNQHEPDPRLTGVLVQLYDNANSDPVMRDYAIQHLSEWRWKAARLKAGDLLAIDHAIWSAAAQSDQSFSGTALLALVRLRDDPLMPDHATLQGPEFRQRLADAAQVLASNPEANLAARLSALSACGRMENQAAAPLVFDLAHHAENPILRAVAIHAAAQLAGSPAAREELAAYLETQTSAPDRRIQMAAQSALTLLHTR